MAHATLQSVPALGAATVAPNDGVDLAREGRGLYVGAAGDLKATLHDGSVVTFAAIGVGVIHPVRIKRVWATGTTATNILVVF